jgi:membrane protein YdbS with pleckstrin-like domain
MSESSDELNQATSPAPVCEQAQAVTETARSITFMPLSESFPALNAFANSVFWFVILLAQILVDIFIQQVNFPWFVTPIIIAIAIYSAVFSYFSAKARGYAIDEFDVYFKQGIWWKKQTALNYSRIQHIDISHGPLERRFKLATIKFFTAGGMGSDLSISGLPSETAEYLRQQILKYAGDAIEDEQLANEANSKELVEQTSELVEHLIPEPNAIEKDTVDKDAAEKGLVDKDAVEKNIEEKVTLEKDTLEKNTLEKPPTEKNVVEPELPKTDQKHGSNKNDHE